MLWSKLGQTWSKSVKPLWTLGNVLRGSVLRFFRCGGFLSGQIGLVKPQSNLVNPGQTWSDSGKCAPDPILRLFCCGEPSSDQVGSVRVASFHMPTPEKIQGVKMGLWQLPLLCLAFLGTRNVGQRINDSIFACSDFLGFRAHLRLSCSSSRFACRPFRPLKRHSRGWRRLDGIRKGGSWLEVGLWCGRGNLRDTVLRGEWWTRTRSHLITRRATIPFHFRLFPLLFASWTPLRPSLLFCSYLAIRDSDWQSVFTYALHE